MQAAADDIDTNYTILVVDDDNISRLTIRKVLAQSGYNIVTAESGEKAIEYCLESLPDMVLLDVIMPGMNGYQTCEALRNIASYNQLPILILTGLDDMDAIDHAFQSGATDFITKPLNWPLLTQRVRYALRTRELFNDLTNSEQKLAKAQSIAQIGYWEYEPETRTVNLADETVTLLGLQYTSYPLDEFLSRLSNTEASQINRSIETALRTGVSYSIDHSFTTDYGMELTLNQHAEFTRQQNHILLVGTFQDITERVEAERKIYFHRYFDPETSLPNKSHLLLQLSNTIDNNSYDLISGVLSITFDKLRSVGTMIGNDFVNLFLRAAAERIQTNIKDTFDIARLSSSSIGLHIRELHTIEQLEGICQLMIELFKQPLNIDGLAYHTTLSIGVSVYPYENDINNLIDNAITAQKKCIAEGGSKYLFYSHEMNKQVNEVILLEAKMRTALTNNEFIAFFQPQVNTQTGMPTGMEALARWIEPDGNMIFPDQFIPLAEESDFIVELGEQILIQACRFARLLSDQGAGSIRAGVNLSAMQFADPDLLLKIQHALDMTGLPPELLEVEITERIAMTDISHAVNTLSKIRDMGIKTSMDDFGTGYSSLSYLQKLPLDTLKIDQSFIRPIKADGSNSEIARAIIAMGHSLNMHLIAEGAEEQYHYELLKELGCHEVQGYFFSKPLAPHLFEEFLTDYGKKFAPFKNSTGG